MGFCDHRGGWLLLLGLMGSCGGAENAGDDVHHPSVILISIDSLRADHCTPWGYTPEFAPGEQTTPFMLRMAREGLMLENTSASAPWTLPSHISLFTAMPARQHGVRGGARMLPREPESNETLTRRFKQAGYVTKGIYSAPFLDSAYGYYDGFDDYWPAEEYLREGSNIDKITDPALRRMMEVHGLADSTYENAPRVNVLAEEFLDEVNLDQPFFLFLHYWDVHYNYRPPEEYALKFLPDFTAADRTAGEDFTPAHGDEVQRQYSIEELGRIKALYDAEIRFVDDHLARIYAKLEERGMADDVILAVVSDHGDHFGEVHGGESHLFHHRTLYEEVVHVPALILAPGKVAAGSRVSGTVNLYDIGPTLLDLAGLPKWPDRAGQSAVPLIGAGGDGFPVHMDVRHPGVPRELQGWRLGPLKAIADLGWRAGNGYPGHAPGLELYDLAQDPGEQSPKGMNEMSTAGAQATAAMKGLSRVPQAPMMEKLPDHLTNALVGTGYADSFDDPAGDGQQPPPADG